MNTNSKLKNTKGNNSAKLQMELPLILCIHVPSAYHLMLLHISLKIMKISFTVQSLRIDTIFILNILYDTIFIRKFSKGHNSVKM